MLFFLHFLSDGDIASNNKYSIKTQFLICISAMHFQSRNPFYKPGLRETSGSVGLGLEILTVLMIMWSKSRRSWFLLWNCPDFIVIVSSPVKNPHTSDPTVQKMRLDVRLSWIIAKPFLQSYETTATSTDNAVDL